MAEKNYNYFLKFAVPTEWVEAGVFDKEIGPDRDELELHVDGGYHEDGGFSVGISSYGYDDQTVISIASATYEETATIPLAKLPQLLAAIQQAVDAWNALRTEDTDEAPAG